MNFKGITRILNIPEIKDFFNAYQANERTEVLKISILHTIFSLKTSFNSYPSLTELREIMLNAGKLHTLESTILTMKEKLEKVKSEIHSMEEALAKKETIAEEKKVVQISQKPQKNSVKMPLRSRSAPHIPKAPSNWRLGDPTIFRKQGARQLINNLPVQDYSSLIPHTNEYTEIITVNNMLEADKNLSQPNIYPQWWLALTELDVKPEKVSTKITQFVPPMYEEEDEAEIEFHNENIEKMRKKWGYNDIRETVNENGNGYRIENKYKHQYEAKTEGKNDMIRKINKRDVKIETINNGEIF